MVFVHEMTRLIAISSSFRQNRAQRAFTRRFSACAPVFSSRSFRSPSVRSNPPVSYPSCLSKISPCISVRSSPPSLYCSRRSWSNKFTPYDFSKTEHLIHDHLERAPSSDQLSSHCSGDEGEGKPSLEQRSLVKASKSSAGSFHGRLVGATAGALLIFAAVLLPYQNKESAEVLREFTLARCAEAQEYVMDFKKGVTASYHSLCTYLANFLIKIHEATTSMTVLARCIHAVLFSRGDDYVDEIAMRWRLRVVSLLADLSASSHSRRRALIQAGSGSVVDWLLESVGHRDKKYRLVQAEAARALSHFLSDDRTCEVVLGRPNALSHLLLFAASIEPNSLNHQKSVSYIENDERMRGRSMLVTALMDIITSSCEIEKDIFQPKLSVFANVADIEAALKVLKEDEFSLDDGHEEGLNKNLNMEQNMNGIREEDFVRVNGSNANDSDNMATEGQKNSGSLFNYFWPPNTGVQHLGSNNEQQVSLTSASINSGTAGSNDYVETNQETYSHGLTSESLNSGTTGSNNYLKISQENDSHGLWDDLHGRHVAVPLAAWAVATWAQASSANCGKIASFDKDGNAILACVMAHERTVKWHGAVAARAVLENGFGERAAVAWSAALLDAAKQASEVKDAQLSFAALDSFYISVRKSHEANESAGKHSLSILREIAKQTAQISKLQKVVAEILDLVTAGGVGLSPEDGKKWSSILLGWLSDRMTDDSTCFVASKILANVLDALGPVGIPISQAWLAMIILGIISDNESSAAKGNAVVSKNSRSKGFVQGRSSQFVVQTVSELGKSVLLSIGGVQGPTNGKGNSAISDPEWGDFGKLHLFNVVGKVSKKDKEKLTIANGVNSTLKAMKALTELTVEDKACQQRIIKMGGLQLLRRFTMKDDFEELLDSERMSGMDVENILQASEQSCSSSKGSHLRKHAARLLSVLSLQSSAAAVIREDEPWCSWLHACADNQLADCPDLKTCSYALTTLLNLEACKEKQRSSSNDSKEHDIEQVIPQYEDRVFIMNTDSPMWEHSFRRNRTKAEVESDHAMETRGPYSDFQLDVVFVHGLCGGPFKTWRISDNKTSSTDKAGLVERIDVDSGREGTCWPKQWLSKDIPACRVLTVKYKTNLSQWSGATLPLQEVGAMLLQKLCAAGVGERPVVFITHSMGGLVVKQMLMQAGKDERFSQLVKSTAGIVFYSCPHFGSKLADVPWRLGLVLRPAPSIGELRSGLVRLEELNQYIRMLHKGGLDILSFSETKVTPLVEGYGGWALRMEVVPIESAYPGFGELVVLDGTDHVNSCKPLSRDDMAYTQTLQLLQKVARSVKASHP
ncbi:hypothetical protein KP509_29G041200 [Ceratopteris richardii]|uniref:Protein SERAC1 n=3 Tax=Ceratopteris richardii TaxID=49495 RepID=A0A8T2R8Q6_CERRI|nr:hypothetical protein KP509_29G041200 [Ceratopteris richardii]